MATLQFEDLQLETAAGETVLDALLREEIDAPHACRKGTCGTCLLKHTGGAAPPPQSQSSLRPTLREQGYFLACQCVPSGDMQVALPESATVWATTVVSKDEMAPGVVRLRLAVPAGFSYRAGQYVSLRRDDGLSRHYSLASLPGDPWLELHIRRHEQGQASRWISDELAVGHDLTIRGPLGDCFYLPGSEDAPMLLIGTGTGLAPLLGIARDALTNGHSGRIVLYHGVRNSADSYHRAELERLASVHDSFEPILCVSREPEPAGFNAGRADELAFGRFEDLTGWRVYLCGAPGMVKAAKRAAYLAGANMRDIWCDSFEATATTT